jgi:hypothetical protein
MMSTIKLMASSADASWLGSGVVARPRPFPGDCRPVAVNGRRGESGSVTPAGISTVLPTAYEALPATAVVGASGSRVALLNANLRQTSTTRTTQHLLRHRFRNWSPPN